MKIRTTMSWDFCVVRQSLEKRETRNIKSGEQIRAKIEVGCVPQRVAAAGNLPRCGRSLVWPPPCPAPYYEYRGYNACLTGQMYPMPDAMVRASTVNNLKQERDFSVRLDRPKQHFKKGTK